jgi:predicted NBD/HSP70 family sugar kinase
MATARRQAPRPTSAEKEALMRRIGIREISGEEIGRAERDNDIIGVTNKGVLCGVLLPLTKEILERLTSQEAPDLERRLDKAESSLVDGIPPIELDELLEQSSPGSRQSSFDRIAIRDFTGVRLEQAAVQRKPLMVMNGRVAVALYLPIMDSWVEQLVENSVNRFLGTRRIESPMSASVRPERERRVPSAEGHDRQRVIGIRIVGDAPDGRARLVGVVTNPLAEVVGTSLGVTLDNLEKGHVFQQILNLVDRLHREEIEEEQELAGVGLEIGGHVHNGRVVHSKNINWHNFPLADRLSSSLRVPVVLENDADALALYERRFEGIDSEDFAVIVLTELGVGCGLVLDGRVYRGASGMAGEFGHIPIEEALEPIRCRCMNPGCLEGVATPRGIEYRLKEAGYAGSFADALADSGNKLVKSTFELAGDRLGRAIATLLNLLNLTDFVIYGPLDLVGKPREFHVKEFVGGTNLSGAYSSSMIEAVRRHGFSNAADHCHFALRARTPEQGARAAAACMIDILEPPVKHQPRTVMAWSN